MLFYDGDDYDVSPSQSKALQKDDPSPTLFFANLTVAAKGNLSVLLTKTTPSILPSDIVVVPPRYILSCLF